MERQPDYEQLCEGYLLGELSEAEQAKLEEAYFADDSLFERFLAVKDDLVDAYARGDLTGSKLTSFEQHYLASNARQQKVEDARDLIQLTSTTVLETPTVQRSNRLSWWQMFAESHPVAWRVGLVTAVLLLIAGSWIIIRQVRNSAARRAAEERARNAPQPSPQNTPNVNRPQETKPTFGLDGERATASPSPSAPVKPEIPPKPPSPTSAAVASLTLLPFAAREPGSANTLAISPEQQVVRLNLIFGDGDYDSFAVSVRTVDGEQLIRRDGLKARSNQTGKTVTVTFDSSLLRRQDHLVTLSGRTKNGKPQTIAEYYFRVQRPTPQ